jgi:mRNA interferase MazF
MEKDFDRWNQLKKDLDSKENLPTFKQAEVWWCKIGLNVGHEENGKGGDYSRPILIIRKFNNRLFFGVPLTTQIKEKHYYHKIHFKDKEQCAMLSQMRLLEAKRLMNKMGQLTKNQFDEIRRILKDMI